jgi:hypothetical protein
MIHTWGVFSPSKKKLLFIDSMEIERTSKCVAYEIERTSKVVAHDLSDSHDLRNRERERERESGQTA